MAKDVLVAQSASSYPAEPALTHVSPDDALQRTRDCEAESRDTLIALDGSWRLLRSNIR